MCYVLIATRSLIKSVQQTSRWVLRACSMLVVTVLRPLRVVDRSLSTYVSVALTSRDGAPVQLESARTSCLNSRESDEFCARADQHDIHARMQCVLGKQACYCTDMSNQLIYMTLLAA